MNIKTRCSILIADDDRGVREALCDLFDRQGYDVFPAENGAQALEIVRIQTLVLSGSFLDMHMPDFTGVEVYRKITQLRGGIDLPTILITSNLTVELEIEARASGIASALRKPLDMGGVLQSLRKLLKENQ